MGIFPATTENAMSKLSKKDLIEAVYENTPLSKKGIEAAVNNFIAELVSAIENKKEVRIAELGTFKLAVRKAHTGRNPATGEAIKVPEKLVPQLKFNSTIRKKLNS